MAGMTE